MNDEKYTFYKDTADKARTAQSAHKFVSKPADRTKAECTAYAEANYKQLIPWKKLKTLPKSMQKEWIERHIEHWNVGSTAIAKAMGITVSAFSHYTSKLGIKVQKHFDKKAAKLYFEAMGVIKPEMKEPAEHAATATENEQPQEAPKPILKMRKQTIEMEGAFSYKEIAYALHSVWKDGERVKIQIIIEEDKE